MTELFNCVIKIIDSDEAALQCCNLDWDHTSEAKYDRGAFKSRLLLKDDEGSGTSPL